MAERMEICRPDSIKPRLWIFPDSGADQRNKWLEEDQYAEHDQIVWYSTQSFVPLPIHQENEFWVGSTKMEHQVEWFWATL